jgi:uncharacterized protein
VGSLTQHQARAIAIGAQGFSASKRSKINTQHILATIYNLGLIQIDSVNALARSHYLPLFSRLGNYKQSHLEELAWGKAPVLFEYWAHEASLLPLTLQPLLRWRMEDVRRGAPGWKNTAAFLKANRKLLARIKAQIAERGPLSSSDLDDGKKGDGGWWGWSETKRALECLFASGDLSVITRRGNFERVYGLPEVSLPPDILNQATPSRAEAQRQLLQIAMHALGVATEKDLRDYFRLKAPDAKARIAELVEAGVLKPVEVEGWKERAFLDPAISEARTRSHQALLSPFDNLIWFRDRTERLFNTRVRLEIYTPAHKRLHGYYVLPFLEDGAITARVDLKADRVTSTLMVLAAHAEPETRPQTAMRLMSELKRMADWLGLEHVKVAQRGTLAQTLRTHAA